VTGISDESRPKRLEPTLEDTPNRSPPPERKHPVGVDLLPDRPQSWSIDVLRRMEWKRFELLAAAYYRHLGFRVETVDHGPDEGIDAMLYEVDTTAPCAILQCKAWQRRVDVKPIRELLGVMSHRGVGRGIFLTTSDFTSDATAFAGPNRIECISGQALLSRIASFSSGSQRELLALACEGDWTTPSCPSCGAKTVLKTANDGSRFWGCFSYPSCRATFPAAYDANRLTLEELPEKVDEGPSPDRRRRADALVACLVGTLGILGLTFGLIYYLLPILREQASRGPQVFIQDATKAPPGIQPRSRQSSPPPDNIRKTESPAQQKAAAREAERKETAWRSYFQRSPGCAIEANQTNVECVNEYIRARREFDHRWDLGQL